MIREPFFSGGFSVFGTGKVSTPPVPLFFCVFLYYEGPVVVNRTKYC